MIVNFETERPTVLGRDLHQALGIKTAYKEGRDFNLLKFDRVQIEGSREMAKEICMKKFTDFSTILSESTVAQSLGYSEAMNKLCEGSETVSDPWLR